jgi:hypothetical protein
VSEPTIPKTLGGDRPATPEEITAGRSLASELRRHYNVRGILILAAEKGRITELRCGMPYCFAPERGRFDPVGLPLGPGCRRTSTIRWPKRDKGKREVTNAVLTHRRCNNVGYKIEDLQAVLKAWRFDDGIALQP